MKKPLSLLFCLFLLAALSVPALADLIWEPSDSFYFEHFDECSLIDLSYTTTADTALYESPEDASVVAVFPAGEEIWVSCVWTDAEGDEWGYVELYNEGWTQGWMNLTHPDAAPSPAFPTLVVMLVVVVVAAASGVIIGLNRRKK